MTESDIEEIIEFCNTHPNTFDKQGWIFEIEDNFGISYADATKAFDAWVFSQNGDDLV